MEQTIIENTILLCNSLLERLVYTTHVYNLINVWPVENSELEILASMETLVYRSGGFQSDVLWLANDSNKSTNLFMLINLHVYFGHVIEYCPPYFCLDVD